MATTQEVWEHHAGGFIGRDVAMVLEDYTEASVVIQGDNVMKGLDAIRGMFQAATATGIFSKLEVANQVVEGSCAYLVWSVPGAIPFGSDTFVVEDGKIRLQTVALKTG